MEILKTICKQLRKRKEVPVPNYLGTSSLPEVDISEETLTRIATESISKGFTVPGVQKKMSLHLTTEGNRPRLTLVDSEDHIYERKVSSDV